MSYGLAEYAAGLYGGGRVAAPPADTTPILAVDVAFTTDALAEPVWEDITADVRSWDTMRGRYRELERFQPGRATVVLSNRDRQYDAINDAGPHFGDIKPMRRIRIRETFSGVTYPIFDGYIDAWQLDYPDRGKDATATVIATDAFKIFARTDLPPSVYWQQVNDDAPTIWWRLDETKNVATDADLVALNSGSLGPSGDGTYDLGFGNVPELGGEALIVHDPGSSMIPRNSVVTSVKKGNGVLIDDADFDLAAQNPYVVEMWCVPNINDGTPPGFLTLWYVAGTNTPGQLVIDTTENRFEYRVEDATASYQANGAAPNYGARHHVVAKKTNGAALELWINGTRTTGTGPAGQLPAGPFDSDPFRVGHTSDMVPNNNWDGLISNVAVYVGAAATAVDQAWVDAHYAAGTSPWQDDDPGTRAGRVLDVVEWPATRRELDDGDPALQSAELGTDALEHLQKIGETEFGLLFVNRTGDVRLVDRAAQAVRVPDAVVFGDDTGEIGYRGFRPDDGDATIRNRATISRYQGVAKRNEAPASVSEFGRFDYTLEGLLHRLDAYSQNYADWVVDEYQQPRRRVTELLLGPPASGDEADLYPQMLGRELGEAITVRNRPIGGGDPFEQVCVIEGIMHMGVPGGDRTTTWVLSPEFTEALF